MIGGWEHGDSDGKSALGTGENLALFSQRAQEVLGILPEKAMQGLERERKFRSGPNRLPENGRTLPAMPPLFVSWPPIALRSGGRMTPPFGLPSLRVPPWRFTGQSRRDDGATPADGRAIHEQAADSRKGKGVPFLPEMRCGRFRGKPFLRSARPAGVKNPFVGLSNFVGPEKK